MLLTIICEYKNRMIAANAKYQTASANLPRPCKMHFAALAMSIVLLGLASSSPLILHPSSSSLMLHLPFHTSADLSPRQTIQQSTTTAQPTTALVLPLQTPATANPTCNTISGCGVPIPHGAIPEPADHPEPRPSATTAVSGLSTSGCTTTTIASAPSEGCPRTLTAYTATRTEFVAIDCHGCTAVHVLQARWECPMPDEGGAMDVVTASTPLAWTSTVCGWEAK